MEDDGFYLPEIGAHSLDKLRRHNYYAAIFSKGMGVFLYALALYSKHVRGHEFWRTTIAGTSEQRELGL